MTRRVPSLLSVLAVVITCGCTTQGPAGPNLAANAPPDTGRTHSASELEAIDRDLAPCIELARKSLPRVLNRFRKGLPQGQLLSVTIRLHDAAGHQEQVFVIVEKLVSGAIEGRLASDIHVVEGYRGGQQLRVTTDEVLDWTISMPDGTEEGNLLGKFIESGQPCQSTTGGHA